MFSKPWNKFAVLMVVRNQIDFLLLLLYCSCFYTDYYFTSRYGDEHRLAGFSATLQAIISFVENGYCDCFCFQLIRSIPLMCLEDWIFE